MITEFVKQLISRLEELYDNHRTSAETYKEAILKNVNQLAEEYNNDFCEWFKYDYRTIAPKHHDNIWAISENLYWRYGGKDAHIKFCPYCGKKIKVVEAKGE